MKIVFMGTPDFSVPVLDALAQHHEIVAVYSQPPRPAGRGKADRPSPVQARAEALGLPTRHPVSLRGDEAQAEFAALGADIAVVVAYGLILPQAVLDAPRLGCLNIHASLLPRWRGAAPIHRAIMAGDAATGVCIMQMEAGLDTGPVLLRQSTPIGAEETTADLHDRLADLGVPGPFHEYRESRRDHYGAVWEPPTFGGPSGYVRLTPEQFDALMALIPDGARVPDPDADVEDDGWTLTTPPYERTTP